MNLLKGKRLWLLLGTGACIALGGALFAFFGPPKLYAKTGSPEYCASCHVMEDQYEAWRHQGAHRRINCIDCHLPNNNIVNHLYEKSYQGMRDTFIFYSGRVPERIRLSMEGGKIVQANCERCHGEIISRLEMTDRNCWSCHRRLSHNRSGSMETISP